MSAFIDAPRLPIIDFAPFEAGGSWRDHVAAQIDWAATEFGFFYIVGHRVDRGAIERLVALGRTFLLSDGGPKEGLYFAEAPAAEGNTRVRAEDAVGAGRAEDAGGAAQSRSPFPQLPGFRDAVGEYMTEVTGLGHHLMSALGRGLKLGDHYFFDRFTGSSTKRLCIVSHPPGRANESIGIAERIDSGLLTLMYQDEVGGLEVKHGDVWINVPYVPGSFVVNTGDMLHRLTGGRYISAAHRVVNRSDRSRVALPFFFDPGSSAALRPPAIKSRRQVASSLRNTAIARSFCAGSPIDIRAQ